MSRQRVDPPEYAGEMSAGEMSELRMRASVIERVARDLADAEATVLHLRRLHAVAGSERDALIRSLYDRRGLDPLDEFVIAEDSGRISRVTRFVPDAVPLGRDDHTPAGG